MTGGVTLRFPARTVDEAMAKAGEQWRVLMDDPEAELPWSTHLEFSEEVGVTTDDRGRMVDKDPEMTVLVRIEFDRKATDAVVGKV